MLEYDIILFVNTHGATIIEKGVQEAECIDDRYEQDETGQPVKLHGRIPIHSAPHGKQLTFLTGTQLGVDNITSDDMMDEIKQHITSTLVRTKTFDIYELQQWLQRRKKHKVTSAQWLKKNSASLGAENVKTYSHSVGWRISQKYVNRIYVPDPDWNPPRIAILYVHPGTSLALPDKTGKVVDVFNKVLTTHGRSEMTTRSGRNFPHISRTELIDYLDKEGYTNPLIIDSSCGGFYSRKHGFTPQDISVMQRAAVTKSVAGGTKKTKKSKKSKKSKRTKKNKKLSSTFF